MKNAHLNVHLIVTVFKSALLSGIQADWTQQTNQSAPGGARSSQRSRALSGSSPLVTRVHVTHSRQRRTKEVIWLPLIT